MQEKMVCVSKVALSAVLLFFHVQSFAGVAYIPQTLRECISAIYENGGSQYHHQALSELYATIRENRMLTSDTVVRRGIKEALEVMQMSHTRGNQGEMVEYLEQYLKNLNGDKAILLTMESDVAHMRSWPLGLIERSMRGQKEAYDLLRLSNELSDNLIFCGSEANAARSDLGIVDVKRAINDHSITFKPNVMTNNQSITPSIILGGTGVGSAVINGWALNSVGIIESVDLQSPVNIQFVIPDDFASHEPISLELGFLVLNNGLSNGYVNFLVQAKYLHPKHSFNPDDISWTHSNSSGNVKITEASNPDNVKYMFVNIPLTRSHIKPEYFALLSISRILPTGGKSEYAGDIALVSAVFKYKSSNQ